MENDIPRAATPQQPSARRYVNHMELLVALSDIRIDFSQLRPGNATPEHPIHLVTSPDFLLTMQREIGGAVDLYQRRFGTIVHGTAPGGLGG